MTETTELERLRAELADEEAVHEQMRAELVRLREVQRIATAYITADAGDPMVADLYGELARAVGLEP